MKTRPKTTSKARYRTLLMTMSQIPDVNREIAEVVAIFGVLDALFRKR
jgi:hypothetical protein